LIILTNTSKRFQKEWIFKSLSITTDDTEKLAILGSNGSGKSTLLKIMSGKMLPTEGKIEYVIDNQSVSTDAIYKHISYAAPYSSLPEELSPEELLKFHLNFKKLQDDIDIDSFLEITKLETHRKKLLHNFSSGMKQRLKLALAVLSRSEIVFLDEPCSNLDEEGIEWYNAIIKEYGRERSIIVCSNHRQYEYSFCGKSLNTKSFQR
jgi:ABC-type multidrug transport system ATPase subunit